MTTREILIAARALIAAPEGWTQGEYARDADGCAVDPDNPDAVCFCALGAIERACERGIDGDEAIQAIQRIVGLVAGFNDTHTHAAVVAMFDEAIARLDRGEV